MCPDQHVPQLHKVAVCLVFHCRSNNTGVLGCHTSPALSREPFSLPSTQAGLKLPGLLSHTPPTLPDTAGAPLQTLVQALMMLLDTEARLLKPLSSQDFLWIRGLTTHLQQSPERGGGCSQVHGLSLLQPQYAQPAQEANCSKGPGRQYQPLRGKATSRHGVDRAERAAVTARSLLQEHCGTLQRSAAL